jgi:hypothetical protein
LTLKREENEGKDLVVDRLGDAGLVCCLLYWSDDWGHLGSPEHGHHTSNERHNNTAYNSPSHVKARSTDVAPSYANVDTHTTTSIADGNGCPHTASSVTDSYNRPYTASSATNSYGCPHATSTFSTAARPASQQ